ncbi:hypothetical protein EG328_006392 [Venturia inaequalis]|uniref:Dynactin subunit 6 n=1 Tax=Venturia inaequalis TaxID=5025 RepID=A0A8H3VDV5_VENIN|nr:hypothetical protein EG328_006392 [Venturia inaequalis]KAE9990930.1 hypothetical protein EG327_000701 [Venturia inaequalis]RDI81521.1 hypothetical protein Vi05172_g8461 [Venturia inaequalis]
MSGDTSRRQSTTSSSTRPNSKRLSIAPTVPRAPANLDPTCTIASHALLTGHYPISIFANVILHPYAKIISSEGPVDIGEGSMVWERAIVGIDGAGGLEAGSEVKATLLGKNVVIETGAIVEAGVVIGDGTLVEGLARIGEGSVIGNYCKIMTQMSLPPGSVLEDYTILYGYNQRRTDKTMGRNDLVKDIKAAAHLKQIKGLQQLIPSNLAKWSSA